MGKLTAIKTYSVFLSRYNLNQIDEKNLTFILETGQLYTHGIFINGATYGTEASNAINLTIGDTTKSLSLSSHTHSNYYLNTANLNIAAYKIVSGTKDLLLYDAAVKVGDTSVPLTLIGSTDITIQKGGTSYTNLDTGNFLIVEETYTGISSLNAVTFKYGGSKSSINYIRSINLATQFDSLTGYNSIGVNTIDNKIYGVINISNSSLPLVYAQLRIDTSAHTIEFRDSGSTTWKLLVTGNQLNALNTTGFVLGPTTNDANKVWKTDSSGNPAWRASNNHSHSYLPLSGGNVSNDISLKGSFDLTKSNNNVGSTIWPTTFNILDTGNRISARLENIVLSNGTNGFFLYVRQYNSSGTVTALKGLSYNLTKADTPIGTWTVHDPASFRTALGLGARATDSTEYLPKAGGTLEGALYIKLNSTATNYKLVLFADNEGGNITIYSPDSYKMSNNSNTIRYWLMDAFNGNFRLYTETNGSTHLTLNTSGVLSTTGGFSGNLSGTATKANSADRLTIYTANSDNTNVYRIIGLQTLNGGWTNKGLVLAVASRHSGVGIYTIHYGAEISNGYYATIGSSSTDSYYTFANVYCKIRYFGDTLDTNNSKIICHVKPAAGDKPTSAVFTFFLHSNDGSSPRISVLQDWGNPFTLITNGATMSSIDTSTYGNLKESTVMNESNSCTGNAASASSVAWGNVSSKPETATRWPSWSEVTSKPSTFTPSSHDHNHITSLGNKNASDLSSTYPSGLSVAGIYNNGYPFTFGSTITAYGNGGVFQIAGQWNSAVTGSSDYDYPTEMYIRGRRDSYDVWTTWSRVITNRNYTEYVKNASLTLLTAGTTQTTFYANDATNRTFNVTCANIGAATSGHSHNDYKLKSSRWLPMTRVPNATNFRTYLDDSTTNLHNLANEELNLFRFYSDDYVNKNLPCVDSHSLVFTIDGNKNWLKAINLDMRSNDVYITSKNSATWGNWVKIIHSGNIGSQSVNYATSAGSATTCTYPLGFTGRQTTNNWLNNSDLTFYHMFCWQDGYGGELGFWSNHNGLVFMATDGAFYQRRDAGGCWRVADVHDLAGYVLKSGDTMTGRLNINKTPSSMSDPALAINYTSNYSTTDDTIMAHVKFGNTGTDCYLGNAPATKTYYGLVGYAFHVNSSCEYDWFTSGWTKLMALRASNGNLWVKGSITASSFVGNVTGNADTVDSLHASDFVRALGTSNANIDSDWGQSIKTFDPIPSGTPPEQNPNITLLSLGNNFARRKMLAFTYSTDNIYYRRRVDSNFSSWVKILHSGNWSSYCAAASHTHSFSLITDGTSGSTASGWSRVLLNNYNGSIKSALYMCNGGGYGMHLRGYSSSASVYMLEIYNDTKQVFAIYGDGHSNFTGNVGITGNLSVSSAVTVNGTLTMNAVGLFATRGENATWDHAAAQIREYQYKCASSGTAITDTWGHAPRLAWHWANKTTAQIGLASNGFLYTSPQNNGNNWYKIMYESGTWGINITGSAGSVAWGNVTGKPGTFTPSAHTHEYLPLAGGKTTGLVTLSYTGIKNAPKILSSGNAHLHFFGNSGNLLIACLNVNTDGSVYWQTLIDGARSVYINKLQHYDDPWTLEGGNEINMLPASWNGSTLYWFNFTCKGGSMTPSNKDCIIGNGRKGPAYVYAGSFSLYSDIRHKEIVENISLNLYLIANAPVFKFRWSKALNQDQQIHIGGSAQYWISIYPELGKYIQEQDWYSLDYTQVTYLSVISVARETLAIQEKLRLLESENDLLKLRITILENLINSEPEL